MNKKTIQIIVAVIAFSGAALVLYNGIFKKSSPAAPPTSAAPGSSPSGNSLSASAGGTEAASPSSAGNMPGGRVMPGSNGLSQTGSTAAKQRFAKRSQDIILPFGKDFNLQKVLERNQLQFGVIEYPKLNPESEIGVLEKDLIKPQSSAGGLNPTAPGR